MYRLRGVDPRREIITLQGGGHCLNAWYYSGL